MKTRIITALISLVLLAAVLCFHQTVVLNLAVSLLSAMMVYELFRASKHTADYVLFGASEAFCIAFPIMTRFLPISDGKYLYIYFAVIFAYIVLYALDVFISFGKTDIADLSVMTVYTLVIGVSMLSLCLIEASSEKYGLPLLILTFCGAWLDDTGAYFAGMLFGKHKFCPNISPKKTVEGFIGGIVTNAFLFLMYGIVLCAVIDEAEVNFVLMTLLGAFCALLGVMGDLFASCVKRKYGIKDYGKIFPGHGGVLDRFDSVLFVAPFMAIFSCGIGIIS